MHHVLLSPLLHLWCAGLALLSPADEDAERGDVPGWVMITIMSAGLVVAILTFARGAVVDLVQDAFDSVSAGAGG